MTKILKKEVIGVFNDGLDPSKKSFVKGRLRFFARKDLSNETGNVAVKQVFPPRPVLEFSTPLPGGTYLGDILSPDVVQE